VEGILRCIASHNRETTGKSVSGLMARMDCSFHSNPDILQSGVIGQFTGRSAARALSRGAESAADSDAKR